MKTFLLFLIAISSTIADFLSLAQRTSVRHRRLLSAVDHQELY
jgi:hypothetical protein